jgi:cbb3-type cytochrome oxidase subunit 3
MVEMDLLADFSKGLIIMIGVFCIFAIIGFVVSWVTEIRLLLFLMLMIPLSVIVFDYWMNKKKERAQSGARAAKR